MLGLINLVDAYNGSMKHLLIDYSLIAYAMLFAKQNDLLTAGYEYVKMGLYGTIFSSIEQHKPDRVWICCDQGKSWRKEFAESYKAHRVAIKEKQSVDNGGLIDWEKFSLMMKEMKQEMTENFPFWVMSINTIEADDITAHIVKNSSPKDKKIIITRDSDYLQLLYYPNTEIYDPIAHKELTCENPIYELQHKICMGDRSDNILPIRPRFGDKTAEKYILAGELDKLLEQAKKDIGIFGKPQDPLAEAYFKNRKLIDMSQIPPTLTKVIEDAISNYKVSKGDDIFGFMVEHGYRDMIENITKIRKSLTGLS